MSRFPGHGGGAIVPHEAVLGRSVIVKGRVLANEDLTIEGEVEGTVELPEHRLTVGPNGKVRATIKAREIVVLGMIHGNIEASGKVDIRQAGKVVGDIQTTRITIEDGAYFRGAIDILPSSPAQAIPSSISVDASENRYALLVEQKYLRGVSKEEEAEIAELSQRLSAVDSDFYEPIIRRLHSRDALSVAGVATIKDTSR